MTPSIVNESGQSVPLCYEEGGDAQRTQLGTPQHLYGKVLAVEMGDRGYM